MITKFLLKIVGIFLFFLHEQVNRTQKSERECKISTFNREQKTSSSYITPNEFLKQNKKFYEFPIDDWCQANGSIYISVLLQAITCTQNDCVVNSFFHVNKFTQLIESWNKSDNSTVRRKQIRVGTH